MRKRLPLIWIVIGLLVHAQSFDVGSTNAQVTNDSIAIEFVIDNSGSMKDTDPFDLRYAATRLIFDVADDWDQIGVLCFSDNAQELMALAPVGTDRSRKAQSISASKCTGQGGTFISKGINEAVARLKQVSATHKYLVLLTDGAPSDPPETMTAISNAIQDDIIIIPGLLYRNNVDADLDAFEKLMLQFQLIPRRIGNSNEVFQQFSEIYSNIKPDRYVQVLGTTGINEIKISAGQNVNDLVFVLDASISQVINDNELTICGTTSQCYSDVEQKYNLVRLEPGLLEGNLKLPPQASQLSSVVIARSDFRPRMIFPPIDNPALPGYFWPRGKPQTLIAGFDSPNDTSAIMLNGGNDNQIVANQNIYVFRKLPTEQTSAVVQLGTSTEPLVIEKAFQFKPIPNPDPHLPILSALNPSENGEVALENDQDLRIKVEVKGDVTLTRQLSVYAVVVNSSDNSIVLGPEPLQYNGLAYEAKRLFATQPGVGYRVLFWLDAQLTKDQLRYGDQIDLNFAVDGGIRLNGLTNIGFDAFQNGDLPFAVEITEANRQVDLVAELVWMQQPAGADANAAGFSVQLQQSQFQGLNSATTLTLQAPDDICTLPEGIYTGQIKFSTSSGLAISPSRIDVSGRIDHGSIRVLEERPLEFGTFCKLPGLLTVLCWGGGNSEFTDAIDVDVPTCINPKNITIQLESISPPDTGAVIIAGELDRTQNPIKLQIKPSGIPMSTLNDMWSTQRYVGRIRVGLTNNNAVDELAQIGYRKLSILSVLKPWPLNEAPMRFGNWLGTFLLMGLVRYLFFSPAPPTKKRPRERLRSTSTGSSTPPNRDRKPDDRSKARNLDPRRRR